MQMEASAPSLEQIMIGKQNMNRQELKEELRNVYDLFKPHKRILTVYEGDRYMLISREWLRIWRHAIQDETLELPMNLDNSDLICEHGLLCDDPASHYTQKLRYALFEIIPINDYLNFIKYFPGGPDILWDDIKINMNSSRPYAFEHVCSLCKNKKCNEYYDRIENFVDEMITVTHIKENRYHQRPKNTRHFRASHFTTLGEFRTTIFKKLNICPKNGQIRVGHHGIRAKDNVTLKEVQINPLRDISVRGHNDYYCHCFN